MIPCEVADLLEQIAIKVERLPGVSRTKPHAFAEAKSELKGEILAEVRKLRTIPRQARIAAAIVPGPRTIHGRMIRVETRRGF